MSKDRFNRPFFYLFTMAHDHHLVGHLRHHTHIVGDKNHRHPQFLLQITHDGKDLRLNGDIQRGGGLVCHQHFGPTRQGHRDHYPLSHTS